jgi:ABC-type uncharacterized transport system permease subunit
VKGTLVSVCSGALIPLELFGALQPIVVALPFQALARTPALIFLERGDLAMLGVQAAWAVVMWAAGWAAWRSASRSLTIQGG